MRLLAAHAQAEQLVDQRAHRRNARGAADEDHLVDLGWCDASVLQHLTNRPGSPSDHARRKLVELRPRHLARVSFAVGECKIDPRRVRIGQRDLCFDHCLAHGLHQFAAGLCRDLVRAQLRIAGDIVQRNRNQQVVKIVATKMRVAAGRDHLEDALVQLQNGDVERAAAKVVHRDQPIALLVQPVRQRRGRRLVHQPQHVQPGDAARVLGGLPLCVVEVCRNGDDRLRHRRTEESLRILLQLQQHVR